MHARNIVLIGTAFAAGFLFTKLKEQREIDIAQLVEDALHKGLAEIKNSKMALEKSNSTNIKVFAQRMIDDHTALNQQLVNLANSRNIPLPDTEHEDTENPYLMLAGSDDSFDEDYVNHQLNIHRDIIKLFRRFSRSDDTEIRDFQTRILDQLSHHLKMVQDLKATFHTNNIPTSSLSDKDFVEEPDYKV